MINSIEALVKEINAHDLDSATEMAIEYACDGSESNAEAQAHLDCLMAAGAEIDAYQASQGVDDRTKMYMHLEEGGASPRGEWKDDYDCTDKESWFGLPAEQCEGLHWLEDQKHLVEVVRDEDGEWAEA